MSTGYPANAREYITKGDEFYEKAAAAIAAAMDERPELTWAQVGRDVGRNESWVRKLVTSFRNPSRRDDEHFTVDWRSGANTQDVAAGRALRDPEQRKQVFAALPSDQIEEVIQEAHGVVMDRLHAKQAERDTAPKTPTAGNLMGSDRYDPSESWADGDIIRVREKAHALRRQVEKWGLVLGSMDEEQAFEYLQEAERNIAEVRAALQERMADRSRAEA